MYSETGLEETEEDFSRGFSEGKDDTLNRVINLLKRQPSSISPSLKNTDGFVDTYRTALIERLKSMY